MPSVEDLFSRFEALNAKKPLEEAGGYLAERASRLNPGLSIGDILSAIDSLKRRTAGSVREIADDPMEFLREAAARLQGDLPRRDIPAGASFEERYRALTDPEAIMGGAAGNIAMGFGGVTVPKNPKPNTMLGAYPTTTARRMQKEATEGGGYSVNLLTGEVPESGYMIGKYANKDPRNIVAEGADVRQPDIKRFAAINKQALEDIDNYFGIWRDKNSGKVYYDVAKRFPDEGPSRPEPSEKYRSATKFGEGTGQLEGYDVAAGKAGGGKIPIGNWEAFINSPEFKARLDELYAEGHKYMGKQDTKQWWDMHGTLFEDLYGKHDLPAVAGFTASTAPNQKVRQNVAQMSEYMRRYIKGEPIIQPEWRMSEDGLLFAKGSMNPMESGRARNLTASSRHELERLSADKVNQEGRAMMGDPDALPLDVYWGRVAEKPREGVFTAASEGVVEPGKQYATLKAVVKGHGAATQAAESLANYSAKIWAAIRERIGATGELFGTKYRRAAGLGESKGYADHLRDLINEKAQMLGITPREMEQRLSKGDANLMGAMLSSPLFRQLYDTAAAQTGDRE